ncbi:MAG: hypothetical protein CME63_10850 [Halobacteriovoraceae bacterium]|nr:hypothetical protein [Halobacteriovoraceae bacterium]|tara:strand:+ start:141639 stop:142016 length:378 start_codon:yes stop_codon:yes gene_type:complete
MTKKAKITELQKKTMDNFLQVAGEMTLSEYGELLGIERTRLFRLLHGAEMKMWEFEKIQIYLDENGQNSVNWENEIKKSHQKKALGAGVGIDLGIQWERNIRLRDLVQESESLKSTSESLEALSA